MSELEIKKGDTFDTEGFGFIKVLDIFISITNQSRVFEVVDAFGVKFLVTPREISE